MIDMDPCVYAMFGATEIIYQKKSNSLLVRDIDTDRYVFCESASIHSAEPHVCDDGIILKGIQRWEGISVPEEMDLSKLKFDISCKCILCNPGELVAAGKLDNVSAYNYNPKDVYFGVKGILVDVIRSKLFV